MTNLLSIWQMYWPPVNHKKLTTHHLTNLLTPSLWIPHKLTIQLSSWQKYSAPVNHDKYTHHLSIMTIYSSPDKSAHTKSYILFLSLFFSTLNPLSFLYNFFFLFSPPPPPPSTLSTPRPPPPFTPGLTSSSGWGTKQAPPNWRPLSFFPITPGTPTLLSPKSPPPPPPPSFPRDWWKIFHHPKVACLSLIGYSMGWQILFWIHCLATWTGTHRQREKPKGSSCPHWTPWLVANAPTGWVYTRFLYKVIGWWAIVVGHLLGNSGSYIGMIYARMLAKWLVTKIS